MKQILPMSTKQFLNFIFFTLAMLGVVLNSNAQSGANDATFNPGDDGRGYGASNTVASTAVQTDGKIIIGGDFITYNNISANRIARVNSDGSFDNTFTIGTGFNASVTDVAIQGDGKILVAGSFTSYNGTTINRIARLNTDGTLDATFNTGSAYTDIRSISIQTDNKIVIAGGFTPNRIARLNIDGTPDGTFNPGTGADAAINSVVVQSDGKIVIGGTFANYNGTARNRIARLTSTGGLDAAFDPGGGPDNDINVIVSQPDGKVLIGGLFTAFSGTTRRQIARLTTTGTLDATFTPDILQQTTSVVHSIVLLSTNKILVGGFFTFNGSSLSHIEKLNADGSLDGTFVRGSGTDNTVNTISVRPDNKIVLGGAFLSYNGTFIVRVSLVQSDGNIDADFNPVTGAFGTINKIIPLASGKALIGGGFSVYNNERLNNFIRINSDGSKDATFNGNASGVVNAIAAQTDNKILIGGTFSSVHGSSRIRIARVNADGTLDATFTTGTGANNGVTAIGVQADGKIIISGAFTAYNGTTITRIARLNADGTLDATFNVGGSGLSAGARAIAFQSDGKILVAGPFTTYNGTTTGGFIRLNTNGTLDGTFAPNISGTVQAMEVQPDDQILVAGGFTSVNGVSKNSIARFNTNGTVDGTFTSGAGVGASEILSIALQTNGKIVIGGTFSSYDGTARNRIAVLNSSGSIDTSFDPGNGTGTLAVNTVAVQPDGNILLGGAFNEYNGVLRNRIARAIVSSCSTPAQPGTITGSASICSGSTNSYSIAAVGGATSYTWTLPGGWTGTSTTTSINATANATSGNVTVTANNACGSSPARLLAVTVNSTPAQPGTITGDATVCASTSETYSVTAVAGATSYTWTLPGGWTGTSTTNSINATAGAAGGTISVTANNTCGSSTARTLAVTVVSGAPAQPGTITGAAVLCSGAAETYSVTAVAGATSYTWTLPSGWTGTSTTNTINVTAGTAGGSISVTANNNCGSSTARTLAVTVNPIPAQPGTITGDAAVCSGVAKTYSVTAVAGATSYTWTLPSGWTGTSTTNSINVTTGTAGGNISVTANNTCGSSTARTLAVTVNTTPAQPGAITGDAAVCSGAAKTYSVTAVAGATSYTWTLPSGWTGTSTTNSINVTAGASGGNISVTANNACGSSTARTLAVTVSAVPAQPGAITGDANICSGATKTYSVTAVAGATSYTWTLPSGWTGTSTTNSINATASTTSGDISVTANNVCGSSTARTRAITAQASPAKPAIVVDDSNPQLLILSTAAADSYQWFQDGVEAGTNPTLEVSTSGDYTVKITSGGCESALSDIETIVITGIEEEMMRAVQVFPNPVTEWLIISLGGLPGKKVISIHDVNGKRSMTADVETNEAEAKLNVKGYATGVYLVKVKTDNAVKVMRFVKE